MQVIVLTFYYVTLIINAENAWRLLPGQLASYNPSGVFDE